MSNSKLLDGKVSLITEKTRGIGRAIAERYAEEGAIVYANARKPGSLGSDLSDYISGQILESDGCTVL